jgi:phenylalanyl-tRNA synthetase alpha subunit
MQTPDPTAQLREEFDEQLRAATEARTVQPLRDRYLGRKDGVVTRLLKDLATAPADERRERGAHANDFLRYVEQRLAEAGEVVRERWRARRRRGIDVTPAGARAVSRPRHPLRSSAINWKISSRAWARSSKDRRWKTSGTVSTR